METNSKRAALSPITPEELAHESWKIFQMMGEFVNGYEKLARVHPSVSIFGSARTATDHPTYQLTEEIAERLSNEGFSIVSGGGSSVIEAANKGAQAGASARIEANIQLPHEQSTHDYQDISLYFRHFFSRKVMFVKYASAYVVMPSGFGTLDELVEILTLIQTGKTRRIPIVLVGTGFWKGLGDCFKTTLVNEGIISPDDPNLFMMADDADSAVQYILENQTAISEPPSSEKKDRMMEI